MGAVYYGWHSGIGSVYDVWNLVLRDELRSELVRSLPGLAGIYGITTPSATPTSLLGVVLHAIWVAIMFCVSHGLGFLCAVVSAFALPVVVLAAVVGAVRHALQPPAPNPQFQPPVPILAPPEPIEPIPIANGVLPVEPVVELPEINAEPLLAAMVDDLAEFDVRVDAAATAALSTVPTRRLRIRAIGTNTPPSGCNGPCRECVVRATERSPKAFMVFQAEDRTTAWEPAAPVVRLPKANAQGQAKGRGLRSVRPPAQVQRLPVADGPRSFTTMPPNIASVPAFPPANYNPFVHASFLRPDLVSKAASQYAGVSPGSHFPNSWITPHGRPDLQLNAMQYAQFAGPKINPSPTGGAGPLSSAYPGPPLGALMAPAAPSIGPRDCTPSPKPAFSAVGYGGDFDHPTRNREGSRHSSPAQPPVHSTMASESGPVVLSGVQPPPAGTADPSEYSLSGRQSNDTPPGFGSTTTKFGVFKQGGLRTGTDRREHSDGNAIIIGPTTLHQTPPPSDRNPFAPAIATYSPGL